MAEDWVRLQIGILQYKLQKEQEQVQDENVKTEHDMNKESKC